MTQATIIVNPQAGNGVESNHVNQLKDKLDKYFEQVLIMETKEEGEAAKYARQACSDNIDSLFVIGGDGTLNEVINGIAEESFRPKLGLLPGGTNNTYLRSLNNATELGEAIEYLDLNKTLKVDIGKINDRYFLYYIAFGELINASLSTSDEEKDEKGSLAYVENILKRIPQDQLHSIQLSINDEAFETYQISHFYALLTNYYGNIKLTQSNININDGEILLVLLTNSELKAKLHLIKNLALGNLEENEDILLLKANKFKLEVEEKHLIMDIDGEVGPKPPLKVEILEKHVPIYQSKD